LAPNAVKPIWNSDHMFDQVLQPLGRAVYGEHGGQTLKASMGARPEARRPLVCRDAAVPNESAPKTVLPIADGHAQHSTKESTP